MLNCFLRAAKNPQIFHPITVEPLMFEPIGSRVSYSQFKTETFVLNQQWFKTSNQFSQRDLIYYKFKQRRREYKKSGYARNRNSSKISPLNWKICFLLHFCFTIFKSQGTPWRTWRTLLRRHWGQGSFWLVMLRKKFVLIFDCKVRFWLVVSTIDRFLDQSTKG